MVDAGRSRTLAELPAFERDGATWGRVVDRSQSFTLAVDATGPALVSMRARARAAKKVTRRHRRQADRHAGALGDRGPRGQREQRRPHPVAGPARALAALGRPGEKEEPLAEIDWIRVGAADGETTAYAAPDAARHRRPDLARRLTAQGLHVDGAGRPALRGVRPAGAWFAADVGAIGEGSGGAVEVRVKSLAKRAARRRRSSRSPGERDCVERRSPRRCRSRLGGLASR